MKPEKSLFQRIPFIRITSLFLLGILCSHYFMIDHQWIALPLVVLILTLMLLWRSNQIRVVPYQNILILLALFLSGIFYHSTSSEKQNHRFDEKAYFVAEVCQKPLEKTNTFQAILKIQGEGMSKPVKAIAYFSKQSYDTTLMAGDQLVIWSMPRQIKNSGNPFGFDYQAMMRNKGIYSSVYLSPGTYHKTGVQVKRFIYLAEHVRDKLVKVLSSTKIENEERAVVSALTLGYRTELDRETMGYFADTGTIHVLSVSGLHVALIYFILNFLFSPIKHGMIGSVFYSILMFLCLWTYAFVTGFSPSVQRSAVMFSFVIIGSILRRPVNIYNSLAASALVLLLLDPNVLFDIGFQLSYLAVFGIVLLQPPLEGLLPVKNKILKWAWIMFTVSIAAQLVTFPLSVYYFNQFPNLFWLSNFIAIPATTLLIWLTIAFFIFSPLAFLMKFLAGLIQFITHWMLEILEWISTLPHAVSEGIVYDSLQTFILYGLIASVVFYCFLKRKIWLFGAFLLLISFQASRLWTNYNLFNQKVILINPVKGKTIHCINGRNNYVIRLDNSAFNEQEIQTIQSVCDHLKLNKPKFIKFNTTDHIHTSDLQIHQSTLNFLNCRIKITDQINLHLHNTDIKLFKKKNANLFNIDSNQTVRYSNELPNHLTGSFSIDFTVQHKDEFCIFMN